MDVKELLETHILLDKNFFVTLVTFISTIIIGLATAVKILWDKLNNERKDLKDVVLKQIEILTLIEPKLNNFDEFKSQLENLINLIKIKLNL